MNVIFFQDTLKCVPEIFSSTLQLLETMNRDHHQAPGVLDHVFKKKEGGVRVIALLRTETGVPNVFLVQVIILKI